MMTVGMLLTVLFVSGELFVQSFKNTEVILQSEHYLDTKQT